VRFALVAALLLVVPASAGAATIEVPGHYPTIGDALVVADRCDVVEVDGGLYVETVVVPEGVTLRAVGDATIDAGGEDEGGAPYSPVVRLEPGARLEGFELQNESAPGGIGVEVFGFASVHGTTLRYLDIGVDVQEAQAWVSGVTIEGVSFEQGVRAVDATVWLDDLSVDHADVCVDLFQTGLRVEGGSLHGCDQGIVAAGSSGEITDLTVTEAGVGVQLAGGAVTLQASEVGGCAVGVQVLQGAPELLDNDLVGNGYGIVTLFSAAEIVGNRIGGSTHAAVVDGLGSASRIANNSMFGGGAGLELSGSDATVHNNVVVGGERAALVRQGGAVVVGNVLLEVDVGLEIVDSPGATHGFNLYWEALTPLLGASDDGSNRFEDPLLGGDLLPLAASPVVDAGPTDPLYDDLDGSRNDIGLGGGPRAMDGYVPDPDGPPVAGPQPPHEIDEAIGGWVVLSDVSDPRGDPLELRSDIDPDGGLQYCDGVGDSVQFVPPDDGEYAVHFSVIDSEGNELLVEVPVIGRNLPPEVAFELAADPAEGAAVDLFVVASDPSDEDVVTIDVDVDGDGEYEQTELPPGFVEWTPLQSGPVVLSVRAVDDDGGEAVASQEVDVANLPPVLLPPLPPTELTVGDVLGAPLQVHDPGPLDTVTLELVDPPEGMRLDDRELSWTPVAGQGGLHSFDLLLRDSDGAETVVGLRIAVYEVAGAGCGCSSAAPRGGGLLLLLIAAGRRPRARRRDRGP